MLSRCEYVALMYQQWHRQKIIFLHNYEICFKKYVYLIPYQSGNNALSVSFVNQELCHVLCDETESRLCHLFVFIVEIVTKVSNNETLLLLKKLRVH